MSDETLIEFPCNFPIKIIGTKTDRFLEDINNLVFKHFPETPAEQISHKHSEKGNFISITVTIYVLDKPSLDALYRELTSHPDIKMVL